MRKVIGFFVLAGLVSLPLMAGIAVSVATSPSNHSQVAQTGGSPGLRQTPGFKAPVQSR